MAWLEAKASVSSFPGFDPGAPPDDGRLAIEGWNLMGGMDWNALPMIGDLLGIDDWEKFVRQLAAIRDHQTEMAKHG